MLEEPEKKFISVRNVVRKKLGNERNYEDGLRIHVEDRAGNDVV